MPTRSRTSAPRESRLRGHLDSLDAWVVMVLIPTLIALMLLIRRQYESTARQLEVQPGAKLPGHRAARSA